MQPLSQPRPSANALARLLTSARLEIVPMKSAEAQIAHLPPNASVSVTCSPAKGLPATLDLTARLLDLGHRPVPHISARLVEDRRHVERLAGWCRAHALTEVFLVAGDALEPVGPYDAVVPFLRDLLDADSGLTDIGVTAYPDGHALIDGAVLREALHAKQEVLAEAGIRGYASTQMCFDAAQWRAWAEAERAAGLRLPLHLGVPGAIDRTKLLTMGVRLGIGTSLRYVKKNRVALGRLFAPSGYDPGKLLGPMSRYADALDIVGLHVFTFNNVEATEAWRVGQLRRLG